MPTIDEIKEQLIAQGAKKRVLKLKGLERIPELLRDGERLENVYETYGGLIQGQQIGTGVLFTTSQRIVLVHKRPLGESKSDEFYFSSISAVEYRTVFPAELILTMPTGKVVIKCNLHEVQELAGLVHTRLNNPPPLIDLNPHAGKPFPKWRALFLVLLILLFYVIYGADRNDSDSHAKKEATPTLSESELDSCFIAGESAATVYVSDIVKYSSGGLMPSTVMEKACDRKGAETINTKLCIQQCELGFRKVARDALK